MCKNKQTMTTDIYRESSPSHRQHTHTHTHTHTVTQCACVRACVCVCVHVCCGVCVCVCVCVVTDRSVRLEHYNTNQQKEKAQYLAGKGDLLTWLFLLKLLVRMLLQMT